MPGYASGETPLWDEDDTVPRATYTSHDAAIMLGGIDQKTLRRWAAAAGIRDAAPTKPGTGQRTPEDERVLGWTHGELRHIADFKGRVLGKPPAESDTARMRRLEADVAQLRQLVESHLAGHALAHPEVRQAASGAETEPPPVERHARPTVRLTSLRDTLPEGYEAVTVWADHHGLPRRTVLGAALDPNVPEVPTPRRGHWKRRGASIALAWDAYEQERATRYWQRLGRIPADAEPS